LNTYVRLVYRNLRANLDITSIFFELIFPIFFIFIEGPGLSGIASRVPLCGGIGSGQSGALESVPYQLYLAAGAVTLTVINGGTNAGTQLWYDRKNGMFEQILMAPFSRAQYIFSIILATLIIGIAGSLLVFVIALPILGSGIAISFEGALLVAAALFLGTILFGSFAIALSVVLRSSETFQIVSTFVFFVFLFTSSVFYPSCRAPPAIQLISLGNPLTWTTDMFRAGIFNTFSPFLSIEAVTLSAVAAFVFGVAVFSFRRIRVQ
jgi:ABC-2 type transport system permease protein